MGKSIFANKIVRLKTTYSIGVGRAVVMKLEKRDENPPWLFGTRRPLYELIDTIVGVHECDYAEGADIFVEVEWRYDNVHTWAEIELFINRYLEAK